MAYTCKFCQSTQTRPFLDLGQSPLANSFITASQLQQGEQYFPLRTVVCENCFLVQVEEQINPEDIFKEYLYFSSVSSSWLKHAEAYCRMVCNRFNITSESKVIEVASNDGYLLQYFHRESIPCLGIEPAANVAQTAIDKGIETLTEFLSPSVAETTVKNNGQADLLIANNVIAHVPDIHGFIDSLRILLKSTGVLSVEFPHILNLIKENQFDTIYHEHYYYYSVLTMIKVMAHYQLEIFDIEKISTHGGSLRLYIHHFDDRTHTVSNTVDKLVREEKAFGLEDLDTYSEFCHKAYKVKKDLLEFLFMAKKENKKVAGYGAPAKGNTLLNYCRIGTDLVPVTADLNENKHHLYLPGSKIPVLPPREMIRTKPDYILILAWNLKDEIISQLEKEVTPNTRFVWAIPELRVNNES